MWNSLFHLTLTQQIWLAIITLSIIIEVCLPHFVLIWCIPGAVIGIILSYFGVSTWWQASVFIVVTLLLMYFVMPAIKAKTKNHKEFRTNTDALIGKTYVLKRSMTITEKGTVRIHGSDWNAVTDPPSCLGEGTWVVVCEVAGNTLIVKTAPAEGEH